MFTMIIDNTTNATKLVADVSKMANTPEKIKKISGKPYSVVTFNNGTDDFICMKCYYTRQFNTVELTIKSNGEYYSAVGKASDGCYYRHIIGKTTEHDYHRASTALAETLEMLGITIVDDKGQKQYIAGDVEMQDVVISITKALKWQLVTMNVISL